MKSVLDGLIVLPSGGMLLEDTLFCGQTFGWQKQGDGSFAGAPGGRGAVVRQQDDILYIQPLAGEARDILFWRRYFALDIDYSAIQRCFCKDPQLGACVEKYAGVRVLQQPFFETLVSFILSQNNHIPRITGIYQNLCRLFGEKIGEDLYACPSPGVLAALRAEDLQPLRAGYRTSYLIDAGQKVARGEVDEEKIRKASDEDARKMLRQVRGVGPKVSDCVLLYSLARNHIMPMDVWMKRAMNLWFPEGLPPESKAVQGIAQQYVFCSARSADKMI